MTRDLAQVLVVPGRLDALEQPWLGLLVIPADPEPIAVGRLGTDNWDDPKRSVERSPRSRRFSFGAGGIVRHARRPARVMKLPAPNRFTVSRDKSDRAGRAASSPTTRPCRLARCRTRRIAPRGAPARSVIERDEKADGVDRLLLVPVDKPGLGQPDRRRHRR